MKKLIAFTLLFFSFQLASNAAVIDTVETYSTVMKKNIKAVVIKPDGYNQAQALPVVYLLHGYSDNYADWIKKAPGITKLADKHNIIIVCPDGGFSSWYWDSPVDPAFQYDTYISKELVQWIDQKYKTIKSNKGRGITGLSMGGHGALYLAIRHQDVFGVAGSMSGGVDIRPFSNNWDMSKRLGTYATERDRWENHTVINMLPLIQPGGLSLIVDCGTGDFFYAVNERLHQEMLYRNIAHDYITRPGVHNWEYWQNAVEYQLLFMHTFFEKSIKK